MLLTYALWQGQFGGDAGVIGQALNLNGEPYTVVGILPAEFQFAKLGNAQLWVPLNPNPDEITLRTRHWENVIGRLRPGVTLEQAQAEMTHLAQHLATQYPDANAGGGIRVVPLQEEIVGPVQPVLLALLGAVGLVLLIACVNVANLLLARAQTRQKEIAVRLALGATRWRLLRLVLTESLILALLGGGLGLLGARWGVAFILSRIPGQLLAFAPYLRASSVNLGVLGFTLAISLLTGIVFGIVPALQASGLNLQMALTEGARSTGGAGHHRVRNVLVVGEIALSLVLLTGAGLLMKSLVRLLQVDPGFQADNLLTVEISAPPERYSDPRHNENLVRQLLDLAETMPGVRGAALIDITPLKGGNTLSFTVQGRPALPPGQKPEANTRDISSSYFQVMEIPLLHGRLFSDQDRADSLPVLIINQTLADKVFPGEDAVGKRLVFSFMTPTFVAEIVGVVGDEKLGALDQKTTPVVYIPSLQSTDTSLTLVVRSSLNPQDLTAGIRTEVAGIDPDVVVNSAITVKKIIADSTSLFVRRFPGAADRRICRIGGPALGYWHLRRALLSGRAAHAGDRRSHGPGCPAWADPSHASESGLELGGDRHCGRCGDGNWCCASADQLAVRRQPERSLCVRRGGGSYRCRSSRCLFDSGPSCNQDRSHGGIAVRITLRSSDHNEIKKIENAWRRRSADQALRCRINIWSKSKSVWRIFGLGVFRGADMATTAVVSAREGNIALSEESL